MQPQPSRLSPSSIDAVVSVAVLPSFEYRFDVMRVGVLQHLDRRYTYDVVPPCLIDGYLFQGIHRPTAGTTIQLTLHRAATVYFFFHHTVDGGYGEIFAELPGWMRCDESPQYDIHNGEHGLTMVMYRLNAEPGAYAIPPTLRDRACFSFVVQPKR